MAILLDCTFRDGGYQTGWRFDDAFLAGYLHMAGALNLDILEIGYIRSVPAATAGAGDFANLPESLTPQQRALFRGINGAKLAVMVDAADLPEADVMAHADSIARRIATAAHDCPIAVIRIATRLQHLARAVDYVAAFDAHGFSVIINLMQAADIPVDELAGTLPEAIGAAPLAAFYVADSFGRMAPEEVRTLIGTLAHLLPVPLGFHAHDNCGLAVANAAAALAAGARYLDATMGGLGRGAGNAQTESLRLLLEHRPDDAALASLEVFLAEHVEPLRAQARWGASPVYRRQARAGLHPTYAQRLAEDAGLSESGRLALLARLADTAQPGRFDADSLAIVRQAS